MTNTNEVGDPVPSNVTVVDNKGIHIRTKNIETATNCYPGRLVIHGTDDIDVIIHDGAVTSYAVGWLSNEHTNKKDRPASRTTIFAQNAKAAVVNGPGIVVYGELLSGENALYGAILKSAATGMLAAGCATTDFIVAKAEQSVSASGTGSSPIKVRSLI